MSVRISIGGQPITLPGTPIPAESAYEDRIRPGDKLRLAESAVAGTFAFERGTERLGTVRIPRWGVTIQLGEVTATAKLDDDALALRMLDGALVARSADDRLTLPTGSELRFEREYTELRGEHGAAARFDARVNGRVRIVLVEVAGPPSGDFVLALAATVVARRLRIAGKRGFDRSGPDGNESHGGAHSGGTEHGGGTF